MTENVGHEVEERQRIAMERVTAGIEESIVGPGIELMLAAKELAIRVSVRVGLMMMRLVVNAFPERRRDEIEAPEQGLERTAQASVRDHRLMAHIMGEKCETSQAVADDDGHEGAAPPRR